MENGYKGLMEGDFISMSVGSVGDIIHKGGPNLKTLRCEEKDIRVAIASDHGGGNIRKEIIPLMEELNIEYIDIGCECSTSVDFLDYAIPVANMVANDEVDRGILICGTGIGMSIMANKSTRDSLCTSP